jgi:hypothetical protein
LTQLGCTYQGADGLGRRIAAKSRVSIAVGDIDEGTRRKAKSKSVAWSGEAGEGRRIWDGKRYPDRNARVTDVT